MSWSTILRKRDGYRRAFADWDVETIARFGARRTSSACSATRDRPAPRQDRVRDRDARATSRSTFPLGELLWSFVGEEPRVNAWRTVAEIPQTAESLAMSKELKRRGFRFTGPTTCYAFMQSAGLVDDHTIDCFRRTG